jgi:hypothetical protein
MFSSGARGRTKNSADVSVYWEGVALGIGHKCRQVLLELYDRNMQVRMEGNRGINEGMEQ